MHNEKFIHKATFHTGKHLNIAPSATNLESDMKPSTSLGELVESVPLTQERPNSVKLYKAYEDENGASKNTTSAWGKTAGSLLKSPLGNSELSFFSRWGYSDNNRPAVRLSLSLESFDTQLEQIALENEEADEVAVPLQPKRPRNQTPVKENSSLWNFLGFTFPPDGQYASKKEMKHMTNMVSYVVSEGAAEQSRSELVHSRILTERQQPCAEVETTAASTTSSIAAATSSGDAELIKRQRRLRVFQEITLFPVSPQHVL